MDKESKLVDIVITPDVSGFKPTDLLQSSTADSVNIPATGTQPTITFTLSKLQPVDVQSITINGEQKYSL